MNPRPRWALVSASAWNLSAQALPSAAAIASIPILIGNLGAAGFGFLSLAYVLVGYFSILDFGISRSLTRSVAQRLGAADPQGAQEAASVGLALLIGLSVPMALAAFLATPYWLTWFGAQDRQLLAGSSSIALAIAAAIPAIMIFQAQRGVVEAAGQFRTSSLVKTASGTLIYALPALASFHTNRLEVLVWTIVGARVVGIVGYAVLATDSLRWRWPRTPKPVLKELMTFGAWVTLSSILSPIMIYADRFFIGHGTSLADAGTYAVAFDVLTKLLIIPAAVGGAVYPMAAQHDAGDARARELFLRGLLLTALPLGAALCITLPIAPVLLGLWIDTQLAAALRLVVPILAIGVMLNALAHMPYAILQARGDARSPALLHLIEFPLYLITLVICLDRWGIAGAAAAWTARCALDLALLMYLVARRGNPLPGLTRPMLVAPACALLVTIMACYVTL